MLVLFIYLAIGGFLVSWFVMASEEMHREVPKLFKKYNLDGDVPTRIFGCALWVLALIIIWLPGLIYFMYLYFKD